MILKATLHWRQGLEGSTAIHYDHDRNRSSFRFFHGKKMTTHRYVILDSEGNPVFAGSSEEVSTLLGSLDDNK